MRQSSATLWMVVSLCVCGYAVVPKGTMQAEGISEHMARKASFFMHETAEDISALPTAPLVSRIISNGVTYYAKLTNRYRLMSLGSTSDGGTNENRTFYCRIPEPLSSEEAAAIAVTDVIANQAMTSTVRAGIYELLMSLDCFVGAGDNGFQEPPPMFKYCPLGAFHQVSDTDDRSSHPFEDDDAPTADQVSQRTLLGTYDEREAPRWSSEDGYWVLRLADGARCGQHESRRYSTTVVFRCTPVDRTGDKVVWLVTRRGTCQYTIELETTAVCAWHAALRATRMCPIPCLSL